MNQTLPSGVTLDNGRGGLPRLTIATTACTAELYLLGAHLCGWQPVGHPHPVLWMSDKSRFEAGVAIRGGVPICFPWFGPKAGDPSAPGHGVARIRPWTLDRVDVDADGTIAVRLTLTSDTDSRACVPLDFALVCDVRLGHTLSMGLTVSNPAATPLIFEEALHTYFSVSDVRQVGVTGLAGATYVDKTDAARRKTQAEEVITISAETDRLYLNTEATIALADPGFARRISVAKTGSRASVVWNPWVAKSKAMPDFGDDEWPGMICIETVNAADNAVTLAPQQSHTMTATVSVLPAEAR
jgi:glucose-6-phosphate 1-epimerase